MIHSTLIKQKGNTLYPLFVIYLSDFWFILNYVNIYCNTHPILSHFVSKQLVVTCLTELQGTVLNSWSAMWVVLSDDGVDFYKKKTDRSPKGMIPLKGATLTSPCQDFGKRMVRKCHLYQSITDKRIGPLTHHTCSTDAAWP